MTTLNQLRLKIEAAQDALLKTDGGPWAHLVYQTRRAEAWRAAFEWREEIYNRYSEHDVFSETWEKINAEYKEGMALIREKLN
jgi:hypothetical protein